MVGGYGYPHSPAYRWPEDSIGASVASAVTFLAGVWLIIAPWVLACNEAADATTATINDMVVGAIVLLAAMSSAAMTLRHRAGRRNESRDAETERQ